MLERCSAADWRWTESLMVGLKDTNLSISLSLSMSSSLKVNPAAAGMSCMLCDSPSSCTYTSYTADHLL